MEYKLVPMAPTREMIEAGQNLLFIEDIYRAMLAAAPSPAWVKVSELLPQEIYGDEKGNVWGVRVSTGEIQTPHYSQIIVRPDLWSHWMLKPRQQPPAPPTAAPAQPPSADHTPQAPGE